jgi:hypothetical protein
MRANAIFILILAFVLSAQTISAQEIREFYNGARQMAMGGVYVTTANDETALIVQPAGLGRVREKYLTLIDPEISVGTNAQTLIGLNIASFLDVNLTNALLQAADPEERFHQSLKLFPSIVFPNFGFGVYANYITDASISAAGTEYLFYTRQDVGFITGLNFRLFDGMLKVGVNARGINRTEVDRTDLNPLATHTLSSIGAKEGFGIGIDTGLLIQIPWDWIPTLGVVYHDVGQTNYSLLPGKMNGLDAAPASTPAGLDVGIGFHPIIGKGNRMTISAEVRDALNYATQEDPTEYVHAGMEFNFKDAFFLRVGTNQSYLTYGLELSLLNYQLQVSSYGEEVGTGTTKLEERRYVFKFAFRF